MPRYNPNNKQHRKTLATRITKMLVAAGYSLDKTARSAEDVYRLDLTGVKVGTAYVRVSTSISKGEMRTVGTDAIRVYAVYTNNAGQSRGLVKTTNINRTGDMAAITGRLLAALRRSGCRRAKRQLRSRRPLAASTRLSRQRRRSLLQPTISRLATLSCTLR